MSKVINNEVTEKDFESEDFLIRLNYVETSEPDRIAKDLQNKDQRIAELEKEKQKDKLLLNMYECDTLEELTNDFSEMQSRFLEALKENDELKKQLKNAIVPKFKDKEWVYTIQDGKIYNVCVKRDVFIEYSFVYNCKPYIDEDGFEDIDCDFAIENEKNLFKTKEEAEKALKGEANA